MGCLFWVSPACVGSSVVSRAGSQATWVLVPAQPAPNPLSDSLPTSMCHFLCLETGDLFCSDGAAIRAVTSMKQLRSSCLMSLSAAQTQVMNFLLPGRKIVRKGSKSSREKPHQCTQGHTLSTVLRTKFSSTPKACFCLFHLAARQGAPKLSLHFKQEQKKQSSAFHGRN